MIELLRMWVQGDRAFRTTLPPRPLQFVEPLKHLRVRFVKSLQSQRPLCGEVAPPSTQIGAEFWVCSLEPRFSGGIPPQDRNVRSMPGFPPCDRKTIRICGRNQIFQWRVGKHMFDIEKI